MERFTPPGAANRAAEAVGVALFITMFAGFTVQVVSRYVFNRPVIWSTDLILIAFLWWFCWAVALLVPPHSHIAVEFALPVRSAAWRNNLARLGILICAGGFIAAIPGTVDYMRFVFGPGQTTGAWDLPLGAFFVPFLILNVLVPVRLLAGWRRPLPEATEAPREDHI
ncbi:MAG TPA: TRAP transporter small permease subunit [Deinococcales bacterium]|nr:TRAP transporter small permease subunit [Deinococcales bacterium]